MLTLLDQIPYEGQYFPDNCAYCSQGKCVVADEGRVGSEGFSKCHGLIVKDLMSGEALVTHHPPITLEGDTYREIQNWLAERPDSEIAVLQIVGDQSIGYGDGIILIESVHPCSWETLEVPSQRYHWGFIYNAQDGEVTTKQPDVLTTYIWDPDCIFLDDLDIPERISLDNWTSRYTVPCPGLEPPGVIFDVKQGVGYSQNIEYMGFSALMKPETFLKLATPLKYPTETTWPYLEKVRLEDGWGPPILYMDFDEGGIPVVTGHEGRHRSTRLLENCPESLLPVHIKLGYIRAHDIDKEMLSTIRSGVQSQEDWEGFSQGFITGPLFNTVFIQDRIEEWRR